MPHYENAPITEALIDIRVEVASELRFEDLQAFRKHVAPDYPREETRSIAEGMFQFGPSIRASATQKPWGMAFWNATNTQVLQVRLDGFTLSRLKPYQDFEHLRDEARRLWNIYRDLVRPKRVTRVAVRYINQFNIPTIGVAKIEAEDYFNVFPRITDKLPSELRDFGPYLMNLHLHQPDLKGMLVLNEVMTPPALPETISIVLDFDLYVEDPPVTNEPDLWAFFDRLRERKNIYFEACITDKARELIR
jgi:uncharacterized protein (TIGR04255 family)